MHRPICHVLLTCTLLLSLLAAAPASAGAPDLDDLTKRRKRLEVQVEQALVQLEQLETARAATRDRLASTTTQHRRTRRELRRSQDQLQAQVRQQYMHRSAFDLPALLAADGPTDVVERTAVMSRMNHNDVEVIEGADALEQRLRASSRLLEQQREELDQLESTMRERTAQLQTTLDTTARKERFLRATTTGARSVADGPMNGSYACIFDKGDYHFIDSWGFARSGGRSHEGADVMAPRGVNVYAFTDGTIGELSTGGLGGISLRIMGDDGHRYYYAHMQSFADNIASGTRVKAGQLVGYNGDSGNARGGPTHVHFQVHPSDGAPTNPYPWLRAVCP